MFQLGEGGATVPLDPPLFKSSTTPLFCISERSEINSSPTLIVDLLVSRPPYSTATDDDSVLFGSMTSVECIRALAQLSRLFHFFVKLSNDHESLEGHGPTDFSPLRQMKTKSKHNDSADLC